jgi:hypothetical protein
MALTQVASGLIASVSGASLTGTQNIPKATLPAGSIIQVTTYSSSLTASTTSATPVSTSLTVSITPLSSSNKVLVMVDTQLYSSTTSNGVAILLYRNSTRVKDAAADGGPKWYTRYDYTANQWSQQSIIYVDSPATTSSTAYTVYLASYNSGTSVTLGGGNTIYTSTITAMEISA